MYLQSREVFLIPLKHAALELNLQPALNGKKAISGIVFLEGTAIVLCSIIAVDLFYLELISNSKIALVSFA